MKNYIEIAKKWSEKGFSVIPVGADKQPMLNSWMEYQKRPMTMSECEKYFKHVWGIGLVMGTDKKLTALDLDLKYSTNPYFLEEYKKAIGGELLRKFYVQTTKNKGMHFVFSSDVLEPNQKMAARYTTIEEKHEVYMEAYKNIKTRGLALKIALNHKALNFVETRGSAGYIVLAPSPGYNPVFGKIGHLSSDEYEELMSVTRSFNEYKELHKEYKVEKYKNLDVNPFEIYNEKGDVIDLLLSNGWEEVYDSGSTLRLKRAGNPSSKSSALYDKNTRIFNVFSTSTIFDPNKGYNPASVFIMLEADGDASEAYRLLIELGYGENI